MRDLRKALAQSEKETFTLDRGCWERGCMAHDERDGDGVNISAERVDETAKRKHEWKGLDGEIPGLGLVTEEFYNGMLFAEDILRERNGG
jgi:hypothetical protein